MQTNPRECIEGIFEQLEILARQANSSIFNPVVVLVDKDSPWVTKTKMIMQALSLRAEEEEQGLLTGYANWSICEIAARSAPGIAEHILRVPSDPQKVKVVFFLPNTGWPAHCLHRHSN